jgi:Flp pilus assembly protein TadG
MKGLRKIAERLLRDDRGVAALELSMVAPFLIVAVLGTADLGRLAYLKFSGTYAVGAGAAYVAGHPGASASGVVNAATTYSAFAVTTSAPYYGCPGANGVTPASAGQICALTNIAAGTYVTITARAAFNPIFNPSVVSYPSSVTTQAVVRTS